MSDHRRFGERGQQGAQVRHGERIDDGRTVVECELDDHQARRVGTFGVKLRIQRDARPRVRARIMLRGIRESRRSKRSRRSRSFRFFVVHETGTTMRLAPMLSAIFDIMHENGQAVAEYRQHRAERNRDRAHRPNVHPHRHLKRRGRRRCNGSTESGDHAHRDQKRRRSYRKAFDPRRQPLQIFVQVEHVRRPLIDPIPQHRRQDESDDVDEGSSTGPKIAPFITASASVTENGADATTAKTAMASGIANNPIDRIAASTCG